MRYAQKALDLEPDSEYSWGALANLYYAQKDKAKANESITKALQIDPSNPWLLEVKKKISKMS